MVVAWRAAWTAPASMVNAPVKELDPVRIIVPSCCLDREELPAVSLMLPLTTSVPLPPLEV